KTIRDAWNSTDPDGVLTGQYTADAQAVSLVFSREPNNSAGSFQMLLPQALEEETLTEQNGLLQVGFGMLKAIAGDFDGDKMRAQVRIATENTGVYEDLRLGRNFLQEQGAAAKIGTRESEIVIIERMGAAQYEGG